MAYPSIDDVRFINFPRFCDENGDLAVFEGRTVVPFDIRRVFVVSAYGGAVRGQHAHRDCAQLLVVLRGACSVLCDDGERKTTCELGGGGGGLLIPAGIWAEQTYIGNDSLLMVLCDQPYSEAEYIRDYGAFLHYRRDLLAAERS